jgi:TonB family protein
MPRLKLVIAALLLLSASPGKAATPLDPESKVTPPVKISGWQPVYPELARRAFVQGAVVVKTIIDEHGDIAAAQIVESLPLGLDEAALAAVKTWKFKPATLEGRPVKVSYTLTVNFAVKEGSPTYGPLFRSFLIKHPDFAGLLVTQRFQEAGQILDRLETEQPASPEIVVARCYLLLDQDRLQEAWQTAQSYHGPEPFELPYMIGRAAVGMMMSKGSSRKIPSPAARAEIIDLGLQAETRAMAVKKDSLTPVFYKSQLLLEKSKLASDPRTRESLAAEAQQLEALARDLYSKGGNPDPFALPPPSQ